MGNNNEENKNNTKKIEKNKMYVIVTKNADEKGKKRREWDIITKRIKITRRR